MGHARLSMVAALAAFLACAAPAEAVSVKWLTEGVGVLASRLFRQLPPNASPVERLEEVFPDYRAVMREYAALAGDAPPPPPEKFGNAFYRLMARAGYRESLYLVCRHCIELALPEAALKRSQATLTRLDIAALDALHGNGGMADYVLSGLRDGKVVTAFPQPVPGQRPFEAAAVAEVFRDAVMPLEGRQMDPAGFTEAVTKNLQAEAQKDQSRLDIEKIEIDAADMKASFHLKAGRTSIDVVNVDLAKALDRLKYLAFGGGGVYVFGPVSDEREAARAEKAQQMFADNAPARTAASRHLAWARELVRMTE